MRLLLDESVPYEDLKPIVPRARRSIDSQGEVAPEALRLRIETCGQGMLKVLARKPNVVSAQEILAEIQKLPPEDRQRLLNALLPELRDQAEARQLTSEEEVDRILLAEGTISKIPALLPDDEEETYEPIDVPGKPLSETIIEERR